MDISFEKMLPKHQKPVMDIFNHYVEHSLSAYPEHVLPLSFYKKFLESTKGFPAYAIKAEGKVVGFCFLKAYNPHSTFKACAEITYFIDKDFVGKGLGKLALAKIESEARLQGIDIILANISSENRESLTFHERNGFVECGRFKKIARKNGIPFDIVWMQKELT